MKSGPPIFTLRKATLADTPTLERIIADSVWGLSRADYTDVQIEAALGSAFGVDTQLIQDGTYFVVEANDEIVACGGWSYRKTLFGSDSQVGRESVELDPGLESARIRAFFVHPEWARRGIGALLLERCESEARSRGFCSTELVATLPGQRLYERFGYVSGEKKEYALRDGITISLIPMKKILQKSRR